MNWTLFVALVAAAASGGAVVNAVLSYLKERRQAKATAKVAEGSVNALIDTSNVAALQAHLVYLEKVIDITNKQQDRTQVELEELRGREHKCVQRLYEVEEQTQTLRLRVSQLEQQLGI